eukprot:1159036-Pelagomonas_calceolata.AAC.6
MALHLRSFKAVNSTHTRPSFERTDNVYSMALHLRSFKGSNSNHTRPCFEREIVYASQPELVRHFHSRRQGPKKYQARDENLANYATSQSNENFIKVMQGSCAILMKSCRLVGIRETCGLTAMRETCMDQEPKATLSQCQQADG